MSKKKALLVTTVSGFVPQFEMNNVKILQGMGYEIHYATNYNMPVYSDNNERLQNTDIKKYQVDFVRSPFRILKNIRAYKQLKKIMKCEKYELVHCHTPMGGVLGRLAAKSANSPYVIYTAHGFHFYKGAPLMNWLLFYPIERWLAKITDILITINQEDYNLANRFRIRKKNGIKLIPGVGVDTEQKKVQAKKDFKNSLGLKENDYVITSVGELSKRKNHQVAIKAMAKVVKKRPDIVYIICGTGRVSKKLEKLIEKFDLKGNVKLLGYRTDVDEILSISNCLLFPSRQEGLPVAVLEAMSSSLPVICSDIRGNRDLIKDGQGGYVIKHQSITEYADSIIRLCYDYEKAKSFGRYNKAEVKKYDIKIIERLMVEIYSSVTQ